MAVTKILKKDKLNDLVTRMVVFAPRIANRTKAGQFVILKVNEKGERIPLTIADSDPEKGTVTIIYQVVGKTTMLLDKLNVDDYILDFVGPLGKPTQLGGYKKVAVIGGGVGCAIAYPQAKQLYNQGSRVDVIAGFRNKDIVILEDEMRKVSDWFAVMTDDGSNGNKGFVTDALRKNLEQHREYDLVTAIGPLVMMKAVCNLTKQFGIKTLVSMNPIMIDGTGMCGCCRVTVDGKTKFACVDGPDFDGHKVDFDEALLRTSVYKSQEQDSISKHECNLLRGI